MIEFIPITAFDMTLAANKDIQQTIIQNEKFIAGYKSIPIISVVMSFKWRVPAIRLINLL